jgi:hypothetical protein
MSSAKVFKRIKYEPITVKEPHKYNIMEFADPEEFTAYYRENEDKFKNVSTLVLNKTYKIPGYRISLQNKGKENEELILKKDYYGGRLEALAPFKVPGPNEPIPPLEELIARIENIEQFLEQFGKV